jgi:hypothetical protein
MNLLVQLPEAHALVAKQDLPIPAWLFAWAASIVLVVSFFALSAAWRKPQFEEERWRPSAAWLTTVLRSWPIQILCGGLAVFLLGVGIYSGIHGTEAPDRNFAITFFFVTAWIGFPFVSALFGNVFTAFNPWRAIARVGGGAWRLVARRPMAHLAYPERLGRWPAAVGLLGFVWLEVVYGSSGGVAVGLEPHAAGVAACVYTGYTLAMMAFFGTETWCARGEIFSVYFGMFSQLAPFGVKDGRVGRRRPLAAATRWATSVRGSTAVVIASIATTSFDGAEDGAYKPALEHVEKWIAEAGVGPLATIRIADTIFMAGTVAGVAIVYLLGVKGMQSVPGAPPFRTLVRGFAHSLIPIALAYLVAHYFSLFVYQEQAQFTYLLSDPLGTSTTDLFGTAEYGIDFSALSPNVIWYVQVAALLAGHVAGLTLAHDKALVYWRDYRRASRSQYWMLAVMVAFTCFGLYLLSVGAS